MTASRATEPNSSRPRVRRWRSALAALISLSLVLSFLHCCFDGDEDTLAVSVAQTSCDISDKTSSPAPAPHCCHCLAHATTVVPQDSAVAIEYVARPYGLAAALAPDAADPASPFKPPRA